MARAILLAIWVVSACACASPVPPLARGLPTGLRPTSDFDRRIKERFPVGSDASILSAELGRERFSIRPATSLDGAYQFSGYYRRHELPCRETWSVLWSVQSGTISAVEGRYTGEICL